MIPGWTSLARALKTGPAFTLRHALTLTLASLGVTVPLAFVAAVPPRAPAAERTPAPRQAVDARAPATRDFPALGAIRDVVGSTAPQWGRGVPLSIGCRQPQLVASALATDEHGRTVGAFVTPTGAGAEALQTVGLCASTRTSLDGRPTVVVDLDGGDTAIWQEGDMLISVTAPRFDPVALAALDRRAVRALTAHGCAALDPSVADAKRNPNRPDYVAHTVARTVRIEPVGLDAGDEDAITPLQDVEQVDMPTGVAGPPLPTPVSRPTPPEYPGAQETSIGVDAPAADPVGPGCGWAFTATAGPDDDAGAIRQSARELVERTKQSLTEQQRQWAKDAERYLKALGPYQRSARAWNAYADQVAAVQASWTDQRARLDQYEADMATWRTQRDALRRFRAGRDAARTQYEADQRACDAGWPFPSASPGATASGTGAPSPSATPGGSATPSPTPTLTCPPRRPAILDETEPYVGPKPAKPELWREPGR